ncbi:cbb3-type cytochrome c oxidase subunit III [Tepidamorphus gemmatus]|uniref:Cbb3-type cytochrome c oxidase subunit III n=1 Tax=Tepidamorphus gemmatus TaxID=747076 RepID=A0A4R3M7C6_9HYPH|nr:cytochrome c [Tepidamorphus gemmatus]TCT09364.1 cbb3-type cytochrome c oxidase subunit III [Tepidamorphus gemmatus]
MRLAVAATLAIGLTAAAAPVAADPVETGRAIVTANCAPCHAVGHAGASPDPAAPAFRILARRWPLNHLEEALAEGIVVGHSTVQMPEFVFDPEEISAIIAYLETIQE